jgi:hypothetical protein
MEDLKGFYNPERVKPDNGDLSSSTPYPKIITLDIGGRKFKTELNTLRSGSGLFHHQLSGRFPWSRQEDGSYFMDADPDLFAHLLRFMRRPEIFPLFYTKANGFDYDLYNRLEAEAEYFQMHELHEWIKEKKYSKAIEVKIGPPIVTTIPGLPSPFPHDSYTNEEVHVTACTKKVYLCPRQIRAHRGDPDACGAACKQRRAQVGVVYEDQPYWQILSMKKEVVVDQKKCRLGDGAEGKEGESEGSL